MLLLIGLFTVVNITMAHDSSQVVVRKGKKYEVLGTISAVTLYKKQNTNKYYFSFPYNKKIRKLNYYRIIHKNASTYKIRENCRELRRRKIKLYDKYKDGEYYLFKVFTSFIQ